MLAYVVVSPIAGAIAHKFNRKLYLIILDIIRALSALALFFVTDIWQVYIIILFLQVSSAAFTPIYQATIPEILPDEDEYTSNKPKENNITESVLRAVKLLSK